MNIEDIIFRGRTEDRGWLYGDLSHFSNGEVWINERDQGYFCEVDPNTVGQYTGVKDKNGRKIFEGDILDVSGVLYKVTWTSTGMYGLKQMYPERGYYDFIGLPHWVPFKSEVIGNIHDGLPRPNDERSETK